jgi:hypothetical protein
MAAAPVSLAAIQLAASTADPRWAGYAEYCRLRILGLRDQALAALDAFIDSATAWPLADKVFFARWVLHATGYGHGDIAAPSPLFRMLLAPALTEHAALNPVDADSVAILGYLHQPSEMHPQSETNPLEAYEAALAIDPENALAARLFVRTVLCDVSYAQHELPWGYLGDPADDIRLLDRAIALANDTVIHAELGEMRERAHDAVAKGTPRGR